MNAINTITTISDVLSVDTPPAPTGFLYLPMDEVWQLQTRCAVLAKSDSDGVPDLAQQHGLSYALEMASVQEIVVNARGQLGEPTVDQLFEAFLFYYDHDAFITFDT